jgi:NADH-quinone oxidoreductase subunit K
MFQGIFINLVAFGRYPLHGRPSLDGQVFVLFLIAVAAAEAALGLALVVLLYRHRGTLDASAWMSLKDE